MSRKKLLAVMTAMAVTSCNFAMPSTMAKAAAPTTTEGTTGTATPETTAVAAPTATPVIPASGDTYVASVQFSETGISLADADGNTVASEDASNLIADGTCLTITAPTEGELAISGTIGGGFGPQYPLY